MAMPAEARVVLLNSLGEPTERRLPRPDDRDLVFKGWNLSHEKDCIDTAPHARSCTEVAIDVTEGGTFVLFSRRWREKEQKVESEKISVYVGHFASDVVNFLKRDNDGKLGPISKRAWLAACKAYPPFKGQEDERIS